MMTSWPLVFHQSWLCDNVLLPCNPPLLQRLEIAQDWRVDKLNTAEAKMQVGLKFQDSYSWFGADGEKQKVWRDNGNKQVSA